MSKPINTPYPPFTLFNGVKGDKVAKNRSFFRLRFLQLYYTVLTQINLVVCIVILLLLANYLTTTNLQTAFGNTWLILNMILCRPHFALNKGSFSS